MKTYQLPFNKTEIPCTYKQIQYLESFNNVSIQVKSTSQILKRMSITDASNLIDLAEQGKKIIIK